ncbi:hypothetical protein A464_1478 [Salmonella bongori N268-08]|uniref:Uncharacterized protein n=1 Tax=Salmonella bongori N268-08 TaxID=1197719 RepID=S5MVN6_SALBN|nr:hypothetical protein A464_1478 [Salmonella bongori N268-08]
MVRGAGKTGIFLSVKNQAPHGAWGERLTRFTTTGNKRQTMIEHITFFWTIFDFSRQVWQRLCENAFTLFDVYFF